MDIGEPDDRRGDTLELSLAAAQRWRSRAAERRRKDAAVKDGRYTDADTKPRLAKRVARLHAWERAALGARALPAGRGFEAMPAEALRPADVTDELVERQIGRTRDLLSVEFFEQGLEAAKSVGRIVTDNQANGTGFLVADGLVMTNQHVLRTPQEAASSALELDFEANRVGAAKNLQVFRLRPERFFLNDQGLDYALCAVALRSERGASLGDYGFRPLIGEEGKVAIGEAVNIVQHPEGRVKQIVIRNNRLVDLPDDPAMKPYFHYEADTERGSSGSPVFNDQWEIVALHHSGVPKTNARGQLVDADGEVIIDPRDTSRIVWVANEGIRVSHLVEHLRSARLGGGADTIRRAAIDVWQKLGAPTVDAVTAPVAPAIARPETGRQLAQGEAEPIAALPQLDPAAAVARLALTVPLQVTVTLGTGPAGTTASPSRIEQERVEPDPSDPDYARRPGYDPEFLGVPAPLPTLVDERHGPAALLDNGETVLRYHHASLFMNARRRLAYCSAVNIRSDAPFQHERQGGDRWFFDPRLPTRLQAGEEYYRDNPLDRGHLVRRADAAWGMDAAEARLANDDTFHFTNCSPQHQIFNQSSLADRHGLQLWGNLENSVAQLARRFGSLLSVFNGPIFADHDRPYRQDFFIPSEYWKLILVKDDDGRPRALAFRLSQSEQIADLPRERFQPDELAPFVPFQLAVPDLAALTGLDFGALAGWDALARAVGARERAAGTARRIASERDLVF